MAAKEQQNFLEESGASSAKAIARFVRIAPRKARLVVNAIRRLAVPEAFSILMALNKKAARITEKLLKSAVANAKVLKMDEERLYISDIRADGGPSLKRFMSRSMGRADRILKRTTHLSIILKEGNRQRPASPQAEPAAADEIQGKGKEKKLKFKTSFRREKKKAVAAAS